MTNINTYRTIYYNPAYKETFSEVYNDFKNKAEEYYNFELAPLNYDNFIKSVEDGLLQCILLLENDIPAGFLVYTTLISEAIELNLIHCVSDEDINKKRQILIEKFIETNKSLMREKVVTYPMLGKQSSFENNIAFYGFKTVNTSVMKIDFSDTLVINKIKNFETEELEDDYSITSWKRLYINDAAEVIRQSFKNSSDALFDIRFNTYKGCSDIVRKITENIYGTFLSEATKVLLYKKHPVGFCFVNLTNEKIANIPIVAILKRHRNKGFSKIMVKSALASLLNQTAADEIKPLNELNVSCDNDNIPAICLYNSVGFTTSYTYPTAYHPVLA